MEALRDREMEARFRLEVRNRFEPLLGKGVGEELWSRGSVALREAAELVLPRGRRRVPAWSEGTVRASERRERALGGGDGALVMVRTMELRRAVKAEMDALGDALAAEVEGCAERGDALGLFPGVGAFAGRALGLPMRVRGPGGALVGGEEVLAAWRGRFSVGRAGVVGGPGVLRRGMCYGARDDAPDLTEVEAALRAVRWGKAAGPDGVGVEMLRGGGKWVSVWLVELFGRVWENGRVPVE